MAETQFNVIKARYVASAVRADQYPPEDLPEIAFIGRSNVGKSSLINSLCRHHGLARVSASPGKTQTINFYAVTAKLPDERRLEWYLVDLPGYGYARTGQAQRRQWTRFVEEYFLRSSRLKLVCQLVDLRHLPQASDVAMYDWLKTHDLTVQVVATKADKIGRTHLARHIAAIKNGLQLETGGIIAYSALSGQGRNDLLDAIGQILLK
ncbi:ribosome biogenesis GTP-binding protein YihA/YsxC [Sporolituus thermophilus]|uniref:Probable GTP-binding protein EngB n=1 Tax=Sporolituus thermophilus DSM 23256 TaxID=1123285 RepID=A0A1G7J4N8_9FIRM|nr:ribosome biogenesis GTP-binding protein YihA/YsxC [Sporolituus thermophilus]SDF19754.1 GTP-binding protein [Sporolituus thermophilus DSM 23256]